MFRDGDIERVRAALQGEGRNTAKRVTLDAYDFADAKELTAELKSSFSDLNLTTGCGHLIGVKTLTQVRVQSIHGESSTLACTPSRRSLPRGISRREIAQAGSQARIIEDYPDDKYSPSCLLLGFTQIGRPLHIVVSLEDRDLVKVITVYEPDPDKWIDHTRRRR